MHVSLFLRIFAAMKRTILFIISSLLCLASQAQEVLKPRVSREPKTRQTVVIDSLQAPSARQDVVVSDMRPDVSAADSAEIVNPKELLYSPYYYVGGPYSWRLHRGLNVSFGASVFAQFGKNARHGVGFAQNLSAVYAVPLNDKLSLAVGGYVNNVNFSGENYRDAGLTAVLGYRFNEHWEAYLYGNKAIADNYTNRYYGTNFLPMTYDMAHLGDRIGAAVRYNFNPSFSVQVSVEHGWLPRQRVIGVSPYDIPRQTP